MRRVIVLICGAVFFAISSSFGQNVPNNIGPKNTTEPTEVVFEIFHQTGNEFYDIQVDTSSSFNSSYKREIVGSVNHINTPQGPFVEDSIANLYFGETYYWRSRSRNDSDTSDWSTPIQFQTIGKPVLIGPGNETTQDPNNLDVWCNHERGTTVYMYEASTDPGFVYPIYYRKASGILALNPNIAHETLFSTKLDGMPTSGAIYIRMNMQNDIDSSLWSDTLKIYLEVPFNTSKASSNGVGVYPNPSQGTVNIQSNNSAITLVEVYNTSGQLVKSINSTSVQNIDLRDLPNGMYTLRLLNNKAVLVEKILLSK